MQDADDVACHGDSGGPWKFRFGSLPPYTYLQFADLHGWSWDWAYGCEDNAAVLISQLSWIEGVLQANGSVPYGFDDGVSNESVGGHGYRTDWENGSRTVPRPAATWWCLTVRGSADVQAAAIEINTCAARRFTYGGTDGSIHAGLDVARCVDLPRDVACGGAPLWLDDRNGSAAQNWRM